MLVLAFATACATPPSEPASWTTGQYAMGTLLEMQLHGSDAEALALAGQRGLREVTELEARLSRWDPSSDISRLNGATGSVVAVDEEVAALLNRALQLQQATEGSFDVTVGPLVQLWIEAAASDRLPSEEALAATRAKVGAARLVVLPQSRVVLADGSRVDLGGVAKGYALDRVRAGLGPEVEAALLSFGQSSSWAIGAPPGAPGWRLLARSPDGGFAGVLTLRDRALSVSGSLGQWSEIEGRKYGHVIDPRTGVPLVTRRQALVVSRDATDAEALSKAVLILGEEQGIALAEAWPDAEALLIDEDGRSWRTPGWDAVTRYAPVADALP